MAPVGGKETPMEVGREASWLAHGDLVPGKELVIDV